LFSKNYSLGWQVCECSLRRRYALMPLPRMDSVAHVWRSDVIAICGNFSTCSMRG